LDRAYVGLFGSLEEVNVHLRKFRDRSPLRSTAPHI
jgi:hypothetical protein